MKIKQIIENLDKSEKNQDDSIVWDLNAMQLDLSLSQDYVQQDKDNPRLKCYWVAHHLCTDTWVGIRAYFFDDVFVCLSDQPARKSDEVFEWVNKESAEIVRNYIISLSDETNDWSVSVINWEDDEMGIGYPVEYTGQLLTKQVIYNNQLVKVIKEQEVIDGKYNFHNITIEHNGGVQEEIDIRNIFVPWHVVNIVK